MLGDDCLYRVPFVVGLGVAAYELCVIVPVPRVIALPVAGAPWLAENVSEMRIEVPFPEFGCKAWGLLFDDWVARDGVVVCLGLDEEFSEEVIVILVCDDVLELDSV